MPPETIYAIVGNNISKFRHDRKLTQEKLAQAISLDRSSVSNIEQGRQKILLHNLYDIATALGVEPSDLLPKEDSLPKTNEGFSIPKHFSHNDKLFLNSVIAKTQ